MIQDSARDRYGASATRHHALVPHILYGLTAATALVIALWPYLPRLPAYSSFIAGFSTYEAENPARNGLAAVIFIAGSIALAAMCQAITFRFERKTSAEAVTAVTSLFWIGLMPDAVFLASQLVRPGLPWGWFKLGLALKALLLMALPCVAQRRRSLTPGGARRILELTIAGPTLAGLAVFSVTAALSRLSPASAFVPPPVLAPLCASLAAAAMLCATVFLPSEETVESFCVRVVLLGQAPLALGVVAIYPANLAIRQSIKHPVYLAAFIAILMAAAWAQLGRRYWLARMSPYRQGLDEYLAPLCLAAILVLAHHEPLSGLPTLSTDDYHFGETLLPFQQYWQFGSIPFVDLNCPHGIWPWLGGAANQLFFSGAGETVLSGMDLVDLAAMVCLFLCARLLAPAPWALLIAYLASPLTNMVTPVGPALFLIAALIRRKPAGVVALWAAALSLFMVPYIPSSGVAYVVAAAVGVALTYWFSDRRNGEWKWLPSHRRPAMALAALICIAAVVFFRMYFGLARFLVENSAATTIIHGVQYRETPSPYPVGLLSSETAFMITYLGLFISGLLFVILFADQLQRDVHHRSRPALFLTGGLAAFVFASIPYTLGRLDASLLRPGYYSLWLIGAVWPVVLYVCGKIRTQVAYCGVTLVAGLAHAAGSATPPRAAEELYAVASMSGRIQSGESRPPRNDLPNVGRAALDPKHEHELLNLRGVLQRYVQPGETYFDMTNHSARYYYLGYRAPFIEAAVYNAAAESTQRRIVDALRRFPPPVVLIDASNIHHDGGKNSVRVSYVYRYVVSHYVPVQEGDYTLLVRPDRVSAATSDDHMRLLEQAFFMPDLRFLPATWGHSFQTLKNELRDRVAVTEATSVAPGNILLNLTPLNLTGPRASILSFTLDAEPRSDRSPAAAVQLYWVSDATFGRETEHVRFQALPGVVLVPLDTHPRWFLSKRIDSLRILIQPTGKCTIRDIAFWSKRD